MKVGLKDMHYNHHPRDICDDATGFSYRRLACPTFFLRNYHFIHLIRQDMRAGSLALGFVPGGDVSRCERELRPASVKYVPGIAVYDFAVAIVEGFDIGWAQHGALVDEDVFYTGPHI